jgi:hypothetical protein
MHRLPVLLLACLLPLSAAAQSSGPATDYQATITGRVLDPTRAPIPGATVIAEP